MLDNKVILITGGTGSFGKKFTETILNKYPNIKKIILFSRDEYKQFVMQNDIFYKQFEDKLRFFIGDVRDKERLMRAFDGVDIVIHAAALKQVPACEYNPFEAVKTNIIGAQNIIDSSIDKGVEKVIALSTDKACAPVNLYGATKLCSDKLFIAGNSYSGNHNTKFSVVRYGNVAGSRGSVIPFFKKLIDEGATSLPITDYNMTRFWLKLEEAVEIVIEAINNMYGGELYVRKIPSIKITDLAKAMKSNIDTHLVGIRPGEKIHEQMIVPEDARNTIELDNYYIVLPEIEFSWVKVREKYKNIGKKVTNDFEYNSSNNSKFLSLDEIKYFISKM